METKDILKKLRISIHSLRVEGDSGASYLINAMHLFQSTPSVWRETTSA